MRVHKHTTSALVMLVRITRVTELSLCQVLIHCESGVGVMLSLPPKSFGIFGLALGKHLETRLLFQKFLTFRVGVRESTESGFSPINARSGLYSGRAATGRIRLPSSDLTLQ
jgi:hypothetical protein